MHHHVFKKYIIIIIIVFLNSEFCEWNFTTPCACCFSYISHQSSVSGSYSGGPHSDWSLYIRMFVLEKRKGGLRRLPNVSCIKLLILLPPSLMSFLSVCMRVIMIQLIEVPIHAEKWVCVVLVLQNRKDLGTF